MISWLQSVAHIPGRNARPASKSEIFRISSSAPCPTDPDRWSANDAWLAGLVAYRHGYFWEAHEVWEAVWKNARPNSVERSLLQGVIQLANAGLKLRMGQPNAARRLTEMASRHIYDSSQSREFVVMGIALSGLIRSMDECVLALRTERQVEMPRLETIEPLA